jgi:hypothetical protein
MKITYPLTTEIMTNAAHALAPVFDLTTMPRIPVVTSLQQGGAGVTFGLLAALGHWAEVPAILVWINFAFAGVCLLFLLTPPLVWLLALLAWGVSRRSQAQLVRQTLRANAELIGTNVSWSFDDAGITTSSATRERHVRWSEISELRQAATGWVLVVPNNTALFLPTAHLTPEIAALLERRAEQAKTAPKK